MTEIALRGGALRPRRRHRVRRSLFPGLGQRAFELLEGEQQLIGIELLGLLAEHGPAQLVEQMFETPVLLGQRHHRGAQVFDDPLGAACFETPVAVGERDDLSATIRRFSASLQRRRGETGRTGPDPNFSNPSVMRDRVHLVPGGHPSAHLRC